MFSIDNFDIIKELGKGGGGTVSLVEDKKTKNIYALKTIKKSNNLSLLKRIGEEMVISQMLKDKYIVECFGCWSDEKNFYLLFEYGENGDLEKMILNTEKGFSESMARKLAKDILSGLIFCHSKRICHRDLKPANILVFKDENSFIYKLADFGFSNKIEEEEKELCISGFCGTPYYIAPEMLETKLYRCDKTDVWALGVTLVYAFTKNRPFQKPTLKQLLNSIKKDNPNLEGVPESAKPFVLKLLEKNSEKRYTPREALDDPWFKLENNS